MNSLFCDSFSHDYMWLILGHGLYPEYYAKFSMRDNPSVRLSLGKQTYSFVSGLIGVLLPGVNKKQLIIDPFYKLTC